MKKVGEIFADLAQKTGLPVEHKGLKDLLSLTSDVDPEVEKAINGLISLDAAKNNSALKSHYFRQAYDAIDQEVIKRADKLQLETDFVEGLKTEQSTNKKLNSFLDKLEELKEAQKTAKGTGDKDAEKTLKAEIEKLNGSINSIRTEHDKAIKAKDEFHNNYIKDSKIINSFASEKWSDLYAPEMRGDLARIALEKELNKIGAKIVTDEKGELKLVQAANPEMEYFDSSNKKVNFTELVPQIMATNKFSAVSASTEPVTPQITVGGGKPPVTPQGNNTVANLLNKSIQDQQQ